MKITKVGLTWVTSKERSPITMVGVWVRILSRGGFCLLVDDVHHALFLRISSSFTSGTNKHREVTSRHVHCGTASWTRHRPANRSLETFCPPHQVLCFSLFCVLGPSFCHSSSPPSPHHILPTSHHFTSPKTTLTFPMARPGTDQFLMEKIYSDLPAAIMNDKKG